MSRFCEHCMQPNENREDRICRSCRKHIGRRAFLLSLKEQRDRFHMSVGDTKLDQKLDKIK